MTGNPNISPFVPETEIFPEDPEDNRFKQQQTYQDVATRLNVRDVGLYIEEEIINGQQLFPLIEPGESRQIFRQTFRVTALTASPGSTSIPHGIIFPVPNTYHFTRVYGVIESLAAPLYVPIPNNNVHVEVNGTNIVISSYPALYDGFTGVVVIEYVKT